MSQPATQSPQPIDADQINAYIEALRQQRNAALEREALLLGELAKRDRIIATQGQEIAELATPKELQPASSDASADSKI
jgi:hypothetical protein